MDDQGRYFLMFKPLLAMTAKHPQGAKSQAIPLLADAPTCPWLAALRVCIDGHLFFKLDIG